MKKCKNCAWFCHADQSCYATSARLFGIVPGVTQDPNGSCRDWTFDGLEDWEREPEETLVTMECAS